MARGLPRTMARAATRAFGRQPGVSGLKRTITGTAAGYKVRFDFKDMLLPVLNANDYASQKLLDLPAGRVQVVGGVASLAFGVTTTRASTINDNAAMDWSIGSAPASNVTLATTMVDIVAKQDKTLDGAAAAYTTAQAANLAATAFFDGTGTAMDIYLNVSFPTATDVDGDGVVKVSGFVELNLALLGDT